MPKISFVIPCYGSEHTVESVINEIDDVMTQRPEFDYEIICVNDESPDNVLEVLKEAAERNSRITVVDLAKNMGKHAALMAGYAQVTGDYVVSLDDDGQCPTDALWLLYDKLDEKTDVVMAKYPKKKQSALKNLGSHFNALVTRWVLDKPKNLQFSNFAISKRFVMEEVLKYRNPYPYLDGLTLRVTRKIANVELEERERMRGHSNFTFLRSIKLWLNGFTAFSVKPLRISTFMGLLIALVGFVAGVIVIVKKIINPDMLIGYSSTMAVLLFIGGMIMIMLGLIGEYIGRIYICINNSPQYVIREIFRSNDEVEELPHEDIYQFSGGSHNNGG